ncbi:MAG: four-carbon acid sugar kinase family protein [Dehalococcoidia bacterium]
MSSRLAIIADDLTGAADAAAPFAAVGLATHLLLREDTHAFQHAAWDVVSVTTGTRATPAAEAASRVARTARCLRQQGISHFYKKIDSTLRGNIGAEVDSFLAVMGRDSIALVCPAFPTMGRTVRDAQLLVDGQPLADTESARDLVTPVETGRLPDLLATIGPLVAVPLEVVRRGCEAIMGFIADSDPRIVILDAQTDEDLLAIADACRTSPRRLLGVGSAGLAGALAHRWPTGPHDRYPERALVVVGSRHGNSRAQLANLAKRSDVRVKALDVRSILHPEVWERETRALAASDARVIGLTTELASDTGQAADMVATRLAEMALLCARRGISRLLATGGDTAEAILRIAGAEGLDVVGQAATGLPTGRIVGGPLEGVLIITKAGGFGGVSTLSDAVDAPSESLEVHKP